jgi:hypothetical protein
MNWFRKPDLSSFVASVQAAQAAESNGTGLHRLPITSNGANTDPLALALARVASAEQNLEAARDAAKAAARAARVPIVGLFSDTRFTSRYIARETGERWRDAGREQGRLETLAGVRIATAPPTGKYAELARAVAAAIDRGEFRKILGGEGASGDPDAEAKANADAILKAAELRDRGGPAMPRPAGLAAKVIKAGERRRRPFGD